MAVITRYVVVGAAILCALWASQARSEDKVDLQVAIFAYLPDASAAIERLEELFEKQNPKIDIDFELWNPYDDAIDDDGLEQILDFDVVEIDVCRIEQLIAGHVGGIEKLPAASRPAADDCVGPAKPLAKSAMGEYVVPHWVCGFSLMTRKSNQAASQAKTFTELLKAMNGSKDTALHAGMWGKKGMV